jgi:hypothetical protein
MQGGLFGFQIGEDDAEKGYGSLIVSNVSQKPPVPPDHGVDLFAFFAHLEHPKRAARAYKADRPAAVPIQT